MADYELNSDEWWLNELATQMGAKFPTLTTLKSYREGTNALPEYATGKALDNYSEVLEMARLNFADQLAGSKANRGYPIAFRTAVEDDPRGDKEADALWRNSWMGTQYSVLANNVTTYGSAYMAVIESETTGEGIYPSLSVVSPFQAYTVSDPRRPWIVLAGLMIGFDPTTGTDQAILMRRSQTEGDSGTAYYRTISAFREDGQTQFDYTQTWTPNFDDWEWGPVVSLRTKNVPLVPFSTEDGFGVFEKHLATLDRINHTILQRVVITIMQAFRQRAIDGDFDEVYPEGHPNAGDPIDWDGIFKAGPDALWRLPSGAKMWESAMADIRPIIDAINSDLKHLAAATSTPLYVLSPESANGSAEGASLARETHALSSEALRRRYDDGFAQVLATAFESMGDEARSVAAAISTQWGEGASVSAIERAAAAAQWAAAGMSAQFIMEYVMHMTYEQQEREFRAKSDENLLAVT